MSAAPVQEQEFPETVVAVIIEFYMVEENILNARQLNNDDINGIMSGQIKKKIPNRQKIF